MGVGVCKSGDRRRAVRKSGLNIDRDCSQLSPLSRLGQRLNYRFKLEAIEFQANQV